jgi:hypothetical protein
MKSWITNNIEKAMAAFTALGAAIAEAIHQVINWLGS